MAKKDNNNDETPIEFRIPNSYGRQANIPIPINQAKWIYKKAKTGVVDWFFATIFVLIAISLIIIMVIKKEIPIGLLLSTVGFGGGGVAQLHHLIIRAIKDKKRPAPDKTIETKAQKKKKQPKRRKDFR